MRIVRGARVVVGEGDVVGRGEIAMVGIDDGMRGVMARRGVRRGSLRRSFGEGLGGDAGRRLLLRIVGVGKGLWRRWMACGLAESCARWCGCCVMVAK